MLLCWTKGVANHVHESLRDHYACIGTLLDVWCPKGALELDICHLPKAVLYWVVSHAGKIPWMWILFENFLVDWLVHMLEIMINAVTCNLDAQVSRSCWNLESEDLVLFVFWFNIWMFGQWGTLVNSCLWDNPRCCSDLMCGSCYLAKYCDG